MSLTAGEKLAHYEILEPIGKGGMGEVYRARDTKLGRDVAIKVLPNEFAQDKERLARFEREARLLAWGTGLEHPEIAPLISPAPGPAGWSWRTRVRGDGDPQAGPSIPTKCPLRRRWAALPAGDLL